MLLPAWWRLAAAAALAAAAFGAGCTVNGWRADAEVAQLRQQWADAQRAAAFKHQADADVRAKADKEIRDATFRQAQRDRAAAAAAAATTDSLRDELAALRAAAAPDDPAGGCGVERAAVGVLAGLLDEGAQLVDEGAERTAEAARTLDALRARETRVCVGSP